MRRVAALLVALFVLVSVVLPAQASFFNGPTASAASGPANVATTFALHSSYFAPAVITIPATAANDTIVVGVLATNGGGGGAPSTISDNASGGSNSYTSAAAVTDASNSGPSQFLQVWYVTGAKSASQVTINFAGGFTFGASIAITEYSGVTTFDSTSNAHDTTGASANVDSGGFVTAHAGDLIVGFMTQDHPTMTHDGFAWRYSENDQGVFEDKVAGAAGTYHATVTAGNAGWIAAGLAFF